MQTAMCSVQVLSQRYLGVGAEGIGNYGGFFGVRGRL